MSNYKDHLFIEWCRQSRQSCVSVPKSGLSSRSMWGFGYSKQYYRQVEKVFRSGLRANKYVRSTGKTM